MLKLADISYYADNKLTSVADIYIEVTGYTFAFKYKYDCFVIRHLSIEEEKNINGVIFRSFKSRNSFFYIPFKTNIYLKKLKPDVVIIQGFSFPLQTIFLRLMLGKKVIIMLQHRQGAPYRFPKKWIQQWADKFVNAYLFTAKPLAEIWLKEKVISSEKKCFELLGASTNFTKLDKEKSKNLVGMQGNCNFLWVNRLNKNKDPICILTAFQKYLVQNADAKLYMIYQENDLEAEVMEKLNKNTELKDAVKMLGKIPHADLVYWYSAADFYVSGSHEESTGFALLESLACGCIPIVTHIAPFQKMLANGNFGYFFDPGNAESLLNVLLQLKNINREEKSKAIQEHFSENLSFKTIANNLDKIIKTLIN